jgi:threonine/homoserine/homoserine lactone efflux protein
MPTDMLLALISYAFVMSITPGPNNVLLLASGVNYGFRRTIPHMLGISAGVIVMLLIVGLGVGQLLTANATVYLALRVLSVVYLLWLAWRIANSGPVSTPGEGDTGQPMTFFQGALFQWINPKAWAMALTATTAFTVQGNYQQSLVIMALVFGLVNAPSVGTWAGFGVVLRGFLQNPTTLRVFNITMALVLVASLVPAVIEIMRAL